MAARCVAAVAGTLLAATVAPAPTATATTAPAGCDGVTVVVDRNELGGRDDVGCAAAGPADAAFTEAGHRLEFVPTLPGFVCRVDGLPERGRCSEGDAYWSLWWSDGSKEWTYATLGVTSLEVPEGGYVGFAWHQGTGDAAPPDEVDPTSATAPVEDDADGEPVASDDRTDDEVPLWAAGGLAVLVLGAAAVVPVLRRRSS